MVRFRKPLSPALRLILRAGLVLAVPALWFGFLRFGPVLAHRPGPAPALFAFHARGLVLAQLGYPRVIEATLPAPAAGSNEAVQLRLMGFWSGEAWTAKARGYGRVEGSALKLIAGRLALGEVLAVTPARDYQGSVLCQVDLRVRWIYQGELDEFLRVKGLLPVQLPRNLGIPKPGGEGVRQFTLSRKGPGWTVVDADELREREAGLPNPNFRMLAAFL